MPEMLAWRTKASEGGNTRVSCSTDSIVEAMRAPKLWWVWEVFGSDLTLPLRLHHQTPAAPCKVLRGCGAQRSPAGPPACARFARPPRLLTPGTACGHH